MENQQEIIFKLSMFEQQMQQLQQQIQVVEQGIIELKNLIDGLENLRGKEGKEILAPIGRGIFAKTKLISEELIVDIGGGNLVRKNIFGTQKLINEQIKKLEEARESLNNSIEELGAEMQKVLGEVEGED